MTTQMTDLSIDGFERVVRVHNDQAGLLGFIAIHNTRLGPGLGGIRYKEYIMGNHALEDVCGLAKAMTNKNSLANINYGGGKAVMLKLHNSVPRADTYRAMGEAVQQLGGTYVCCEDVGTVTQDLYNVLETTQYCSGTQSDSGVATAAGLMHVFRVYCEWEDIPLSGLTIAIAGLGKVGKSLAQSLLEAGASLRLADIDHDLVINFCRMHNLDHAQCVPPDLIAETPCEIYSPCALGGIINRKTRQVLNCNAILGCANNQLDRSETARFLHKRGITYFPDYLVNAGGVIAVAAELDGDMENLDFYLESIGDRAHSMLRESDVYNSLLDITESYVRDRLED